MGQRIDLGCGKNKVTNCIGVDIHGSGEPDIKADIRSTIPGLETGCAEYVVCRHVFEHLSGEQWRLVMAEIARLLEPGGQFEIRVPHPACEDAMIHGHLHVFTPLWWRHLKQGIIEIKQPLAIDRVEEVPHPECLAFCDRNGFDFAEWSRFLLNSHYETAVFGHRE